MTTTVSTQSEESTYTQPLMDKAFFGKDNCLTVQIRAKNVYFKWGKKTGEQWEWKNVKFNDVELGDILRLLEGDVQEVKFYHSFNEQSTQIWGSRLKDKIILKAGDYTKGLNSGEQKVLQVLLTHAIWMTNLT